MAIEKIQSDSWTRIVKVPEAVFTGGIKGIAFNVHEKKNPQCVDKHWNRLRSEAVASLFLEMVSIGQDEALCNVVSSEAGSSSNGKLGLDDLQRPLPDETVV